MSSLFPNPNTRLERHLETGTQELRTFVENSYYGGRAEELDRITRYYLHWRFYEGEHFKDYNHSMLSFNYVRAFIDKVNMFLLGDAPFAFQVSSYDGDVIDLDTEETPVEKLILQNWRKNKQMRLAQELLQMGSVCGDAWVGVNWWAEKECVKFDLYDSRQCYPEFEEGDFKKMTAFVVRQQLISQPSTTSSDSKSKLRITKLTSEYVETWYQDSGSAKIADKDKKQRVVTPHSLGFIPVVHFKNKPMPGYYSRSDAADILKINKVYNELQQELKAIIDYFMTPTTVVTGATLKNMKRGLGQVWSGLPPEANVFNLGLDVDLGDATQYVAGLKTSMHELSDVPENVLGKIQAISGTSAAALKLTYLPLVQQANIKAQTYGEGIEDLNEMVLKFYSIYAPNNSLYAQIDPLFSQNYRVTPVWKYGFPTDRMIQLQEAQIEKQMGIASNAEIMNKLGKNNVPERLQQIRDEKLQEAQFQAELAKITQPPVPPSPETPPQQ
jgi:hypothetical protein